MVSVGCAIERRDALVQILTLHGHSHQAMRTQRWLGLYVEWYQELSRRCREMANAEFVRYVDQLKRQVPMRASDSLDQESGGGIDRSGPKIGQLIEAMNSAEVQYQNVKAGQ